MISPKMTFPIWHFLRKIKCNSTIWVYWNMDVEIKTANLILNLNDLFFLKSLVIGSTYNFCQLSHFWHNMIVLKGWVVMMLSVKVVGNKVSQAHSDYWRWACKADKNSFPLSLQCIFYKRKTVFSPFLLKNVFLTVMHVILVLCCFLPLILWEPSIAKKHTFK